VEVKPWDWKRILIGDVPPEFLIEVAIRTVIMYIILLVVVRLMGRRMSGQISITEFSVMVTLGAIVSPAMQLPDRAILFGVLALVIVYLLHLIVNYLGTRSTTVSRITEGISVCLIKDGILQVKEMNQIGITTQELLAELRKKNVEILSDVDRVYMEACGVFSVFKNEANKPGLTVYPEKDPEMMKYRNEAGPQLCACSYCGHVQQPKNNDTCENCGHKEWVKAYV
jgi:uncharacterized membrane protein YcaP (DUF421 family)